LDTPIKLDDKHEYDYRSPDDKHEYDYRSPDDKHEYDYRSPDDKHQHQHHHDDYGAKSIRVRVGHSEHINWLIE